MGGAIIIRAEEPPWTASWIPVTRFGSNPFIDHDEGGKQEALSDPKADKSSSNASSLTIFFQFIFPA
jgi:hypothetical protein